MGPCSASPGCCGAGDVWKSRADEEFAVVVVGIWPLLHLQMLEELMHSHGNILFILINAWQTQGFAGWPIPGAPRVTSLGF